MRRINLPNKLSLLRAILVVPFVVCALMDGVGWQRTALAIFIIASITDTLDGQIARKRGLVTNFGKFIDPIADKLLVMSALVIFVQQGRVPGWVCILMLAREFAVSGFRLVAASSGTVIAAGLLGKIKTVTQMLAIILILLLVPVTGGGTFSTAGNVIANVALYIACAMTVISGIDYIVRNFNLISDM